MNSFCTATDNTSGSKLSVNYMDTLAHGIGILQKRDGSKSEIVFKNGIIIAY